MDKKKVVAVCQASLWGICMLLFPILSGTLSAILSFETVQALFFQGLFMLASLVIPLIFLGTGRWSREEIGLGAYDAAHGKQAYHFLPLAAILIPAAVHGFSFPSVRYVLGNLFLYLAVGIAEELYFRGIVPNYLRKAFSVQGVILLSAIIFGAGHLAAAFTADSGWEVFLAILNAFLFGWLAMEVTLIAKTVLPVILLHFLFDFETKIAAMTGTSLLLAECVRGALVFLAAVWLAVVIRRDRKNEKEWDQ